MRRDNHGISRIYRYNDYSRKETACKVSKEEFIMSAVLGILGAAVFLSGLYFFDRWLTG